MIERATLLRVDRKATSGRTGPLIAECETEGGDTVEVFCKLSAGCEEGVVHLAREVVAACLAADLGLPVPKPYLIDIPPDLAATVSDPEIAKRLATSCPVAFGSTKVPNQFTAWMTGNRVRAPLLPTAAAILLFDGIIQNPDRRDGNPNCLIRGDDIRIIDHELCFAHRLILGWKAPWLLGGLQTLAEPGHHIFFRQIRQREIDLAPLAAAWSRLPDARLQAYERAIPPDWTAATVDVSSAVTLIADARDKIGDCVAEIRRILA